MISRRFSKIFLVISVICTGFSFAANAQQPSTYGQNLGGFQRAMMGKSSQAGSKTGSPLGGKDGSQNASGSDRGATLVGENPITYQIHILGEVKNPGTYRLPPSTRMEEAIKQAGWILERGSKRKVELRRGNKTFYYDLFKFEKRGDLSQNPFLLDNDVIFIPYSETNVAIQGPVKDNGVFELVGQDRSAWDLLQLAGGFTAGVLKSESLTVIRYSEGEKQLLKIPNDEVALKEFQLVNGDVLVVPHMFVKNRRFDYNVPDLPADNQFFPTQKNEIFVSGAVSQPGSYAFVPNYSARDYMNTAGITELSSYKHAYVLTADGKSIKHPDEKKDFRMSPGDTIIVPKRAWTTDNVLRWYNTATGTVFTGFALKQLLK